LFSSATSRSTIRTHAVAHFLSCAMCRHSPATFFFFFQAEDGIRDSSVTGVQTCALPIYDVVDAITLVGDGGRAAAGDPDTGHEQIGRASCRGRVESSGAAEWWKRTNRGPCVDATTPRHARAA